MKILLVEDTPLSALVASTLLKEAGHSVDIAENGQMAISLVNTNSYDLIFMDIGLPDMTGFQVAKLIHGNYPDFKIIGLTAHGIDEYYREESIKFNFLDIISKPLSKEYVEQLESLVK